MQGFFRAVDAMQRGMKTAGAFCLLTMAFVTGADILGRAAFNKPIFGSEEIVSLLAVLAVALSLPYAHANKSHISVEIFIRRFSRGTRAAIHLLVNLVLLGFFTVVCWRLFDYAWSSRVAGELTMNLELPKHLIVAILGIGFLAFVLCILADVLKAVTRREES